MLKVTLKGARPHFVPIFDSAVDGYKGICGSPNLNMMRKWVALLTRFGVSPYMLALRKVGNGYQLLVKGDSSFCWGVIKAATRFGR